MYVEIDNYDEYSHDLSTGNQEKLRSLARSIVDSRSGPSPVQTVSVIGHADRALRVAPNERAKLEMDVSVKRASSAVELLKAEIANLPGGPNILSNIQLLSSGTGSRERKILNPVTDEDRRKNRRVEITTLATGDQIIHVLPPWPRHEPDASDDSLPKVFSIKLMEGVSGGPLCQYTFVVWDKTESRAAAFDYRAVIGSMGRSSPFSSESDWADMLVDHHITLESLDGAASHALATLPFSFMLLNLPQGSVVIPLGVSIGLGAEGGTGLFTLDRSSIKPFVGD